MRDPGSKLLSARATLGKQLGGERHARCDRPHYLRFAILDLVLTRAIVDALEADVRLGEERRQSLEVGLHPASEGMVVALGAVEPETEESAGDAAAQAHRVGLVRPAGLAGDAHEVRRRLVRPEALGGDQLGDNLVVGPVARRRCLPARRSTAGDDRR